MIELEKKLLLTQREYEILCDALLSHGKIILQYNHYYDTTDLSGNKNGITYRIREKDGLFLATLKSHQKNTDASHEKSAIVKSKKDISFFENPDLKYQGTMQTQRLFLPLTDSIELALDKNIYLGHCDYELEIEYTEGLEAEALSYLENLALLLQKSGENISASNLALRIGMEGSKSERFFFRMSHIEKKRHV